MFIAVMLIALVETKLYLCLRILARPIPLLETARATGWHPIAPRVGRTALLGGFVRIACIEPSLRLVSVDHRDSGAGRDCSAGRSPCCAASIFGGRILYRDLSRVAERARRVRACPCWRARRSR